jgi:Flp pilus assembly protein TadD
VVTDYALRTRRADWREYLDRSFSRINRIYSATGVRWAFRHADQPDPTADLHGMEVRRQKLIRTECEADLILGVTGQPESESTGSVTAFSHTAIVVDNPAESDERNSLALAQALAVLFGAPADPRGSGTLMTQPPESDRLPKAAARLIDRLKQHDFSSGSAALQGEWEARAFDALVQAYQGRGRSAERDAHYLLGMSLAADERFAESVHHLSEVVKLEPSSARAHVDLATAYARNFQHAEAVAEYRAAVAIETNSAPIHSALAVALANARRGPEAEAEFHTALRIDPRFAAAQAGLAYLLSQELGRIDEAIDAYRMAVEIDPEMPAATQGLERATELKERSAREAAESRTRAQQSPSNAGAHFDLGLAEARAGNVEPAVRAFRRAVEIDGNDARSHGNLAILLYLQKDYAGALREAETARRAGYDPPPALVEVIRAKAGR